VLRNRKKQRERPPGQPRCTTPLTQVGSAGRTSCMPAVIERVPWWDSSCYALADRRHKAPPACLPFRGDIDQLDEVKDRGAHLRFRLP
jgi:hypothetical protein